MRIELKEKKVQVEKRDEEASGQREQLNKLLEMINEKAFYGCNSDVKLLRLGPKDRQMRGGPRSIEGYHPSFGV